MSYSVASIPMTLNDLKGHLPMEFFIVVQQWTRFQLVHLRLLSFLYVFVSKDIL